MKQSGRLVRAAARKDLPRIVAIEEECFREEPYTLQQFRRYFRTGNSIFLVAECANALVGYVVGSVDRRFKPAAARLDSIAIAHGRRREGLAALLLSAFEKRADEIGCRAALLQVSVRNTAAKSLYKGFGYREVSRLPDYYGEGHEAMQMAKAW